MGLGRWRWEGDEFVHHTEEELAEEAFGKALLVMAVCAVLGPVLIYYNLDTKGDLFYVGCGASLIGLYGLLRYTKAIIVGIGKLDKSSRLIFAKTLPLISCKHL